MLSNINLKTGIRFGVISCSSLDSDLVQELMYGPHATDLSYNEAYEEAKAEAGRTFDDYVESAELAASETDPNMSEEERDGFIESSLLTTPGHTDRDEYIEAELEQFSDTCRIDEPTIEGEYEGVKYRVSWLGGAPILFVAESPDIVYADRLCSPCVTNAADLDGGFAEYAGGSDGGTYECYGVPADWIVKVAA